MLYHTQKNQRGEREGSTFGNALTRFLSELHEKIDTTLRQLA